MTYSLTYQAAALYAHTHHHTHPHFSLHCALHTHTHTQVLFWDTTAGSRPVSSIQCAHGPSADVHCVDWSGLQEHLLVTGACLFCVGVVGGIACVLGCVL